MKKFLPLILFVFSFFDTSGLMAQINSDSYSKAVTSQVYGDDVSAVLYDFVITPSATEVINITVPTGYEIAVNGGSYNTIDFPKSATATVDFTLHVRRIANTNVQAASDHLIHLSSTSTDPDGVDITLTGGEITKRPITITAPTISSRAYNGNAHVG
ncbi:MAG: hypothetical protein WCH78_14755, partial [Bacteroidota bacterium]